MAAPRPNASSSQEEQPAGLEKQVYCWACRALIVVPVQDGRHVQIFKVRPRTRVPWELARLGRLLTSAH